MNEQSSEWAEANRDADCCWTSTSFSALASTLFTRWIEVTVQVVAPPADITVQPALTTTHERSTRSPALWAAKRRITAMMQQQTRTTEVSFVLSCILLQQTPRALQPREPTLTAVVAQFLSGRACSCTTVEWMALPESAELPTTLATSTSFTTTTAESLSRTNHSFPSTASTSVPTADV